MYMIQWRRDDLVAESGLENAAASDGAGRASMGPRRSRRGICSRACNFPESASSFNGAATISSRNPSSRPAHPSIADQLQWGRDDLVAESARAALAGTLRPAGFNGAATISSRNPRPAFFFVHLEVRLQWG